MTPRRARLFAPFAIAAGLAAWLLGGCAGYTLGDAGELPFRSIHVAPPVNTSLAPQAAALLGSAIAGEIDRSGRATISSPSNADAELRVTILQLRREISADRADDTGLARKWRVILDAEFSLVEVGSGREWVSRRPVTAFDEVYSDSGHVDAEYQNMPVLTSRLAEVIAREVLAVW